MGLAAARSGANLREMDTRTLSPADVDALADAIASRLSRQQPAAPDRAYCRVPEAARYLAVSPRTVQTLVYRGALPSRMLGGCRVIRWAALREYARRDHPEPITPRSQSRRECETGGAE